MNKNSKKIVALGEIMLRLSTPNQKRIIQSESLDVCYGGAEANVVASLTNFGCSGLFVTKVPDNPLGQSAINQLNRFGVNTEYIVKGGDRLGIYFVEPGASLRATQVVYDRSNSAITEAEFEEFDFESIFENADWFHVSGVTPAISDKGAILTEKALKFAKSKGITTSFDVNYRKKLWSQEKATKVVKNLLQYVDVCIGVDPTLGVTTTSDLMNEDRITKEGFKDIFKKLKDLYGFKFIATSLRENHTASDNSCAAMVYDGKEFYETKKYDVRIIDRVGTGDAFAAGLIYGIANGLSTKDTAEFAVAASVIKHTIHGDFNHATLGEVYDLMNGESTRVKR
jgi:2-dehydro-3-deoxygluconokinase